MSQYDFKSWIQFREMNTEIINNNINYLFDISFSDEYSFCRVVNGLECQCWSKSTKLEMMQNSDSFSTHNNKCRKPWNHNFQHDGAPRHSVKPVSQFLDEDFHRLFWRRSHIEWPSDSKGLLFIGLLNHKINKCHQVTTEMFRNIRQRFEQNVLHPWK